ncbi:uncharacterized protein LOC135709204 [Ochlerotatus camptorhynchus]|uniref:uncharacterized protein LOC135709204 n=1 Tax=Ochlerotatus camptorhynchus TaxID=644619 RepID=UPI0031D5D342
MDSAGGYKKEGNLGGARHGDAYQVHVLMLLYERAISDRYGRYGDFRLATEMKAAGKFDDAVLSWQNENSSWNWLFVQVKHRLMPVQLDGKHLFPDAESDKCKGDFSLHKYLESFWEIMHLDDFVGNKQFVIYTNCGLAQCIQDWFTDAENEIECILKLGLNGERFMKLIPQDEHCEKLLEHGNSDFKGLTEIIRSVLIERKEGMNLDLVKKYRGAIANQILVTEKGWVRFSPRFIKNKNKLSHAERVFRGKLFQEEATLEQLESYCAPNEELLTILDSKGKSVNTLPPSIDEVEVKEFLSSLIFAINQPDNVGLKKAIINDLKLRQTSPVHGPSSDNTYALLAYSTMQHRVHVCLDSTTVPCMSLRRHDLENEFQTFQRTISSSRLSVPTDLFRGEMHSFRVDFVDPVLPFPEAYPVAIVTSTRNGLLNSLKVFQALQAHNFHYFSLKDLQNNSIRTELCEALRESKSSFYLLLKADCFKLEFASEILDAMVSGNSIKLILLTDCDESASKFFNEHSYTLVEEEDITLDELTVSSQQILRNKTVLFQGFEMKLSDLADDAVLGKVIKNDTLEKLLQDEIVTIGPTLPELGIKHYIPRIITRSDTDDLANEAENLQPTLNDTTLGDGTDENGSYNEEQFLYNLPTTPDKRRVVVLSSTPGMGKTTLWMKLANLAKSRFKTKWVFYINLQDCETDLRASRKPNVTDFLGNHFRLPQLDRSLLQYHHGMPNNIYVFFDGFDELPFASTGPTIVLMRMLQNFTQVFVNTRTRLQVELEGAFKVDAFFLRPISKSEQTVLFKSFCDFLDEDAMRARPLSQFVDRLMDRIHSKSMKIASKFVGVPLMVEMLAEIYKPYTKQYQKTKDPQVLGQIDLEALDIMELFEKFVYSSFQRQNIVKQNLSIVNHYTQLMLNQSNFLYRGFIKLHSFLGLMSLVKGNKMHLIVPDEQELQVMQEQIPLLDSPIVSRVPHFIHGSIAEFFAAKCLFQYLRRMNHEQIKNNFVKNARKRVPRKKHNLKNMFDLYYQVLRDYPTVRKFFFIIARQHEECLGKLEMLLWSMRPYPLLWACEENFEELVKRLIQEDPTVINNTTVHRETPLHFAATQDHGQICALLINNNLSVDAQNVHKQTALHKAAANGCYEVVSLLIARGATVDAIDHHQQTPVFLAAQAGYVHVVRLLINRGCDLNILSARGWNALHIASFNNHIDVVRTLLTRKIQMKTGGAKKWLMFLGHLVSRKFRDLVMLLVSYEAKAYKSDANQTLIWAIKRSHLDIVQAMHQAGTSICEIDERSGLCTYQLALNHGSYGIAEFILAVQKNLDTLEFPLHAAAKAGSTGCISILLEKNAEVNAKDPQGQSPLDLALKECHVGAVYLLLDKRAEISKTMLHATIRANKATSAMCVQTLLLFGADVTAVDERLGRTPLHEAVLQSSYQCALLLLRGGASINAVDKYNRTPLQYSTSCSVCPEKQQASLFNGRILVKW